MLIKLKADTSQAKSEIKKFRGEEKKAAEARLKEIDEHNKKLDSNIAAWGKVAGAVAAVGAAALAARASVDAYFTNMRAQAAGAGANIDGLRKATNGLVEDTDLLMSAGKLMNGTWKLSQKEMEKVYQGMMAARKLTGVEMPEALRMFSEAISKGTTEELKKFGIVAKDKNELLKEMDRLYKQVGGNARVTGDDVLATGVDFKNAMDELKTSIGQIVIAMKPLLEVITGIARKANELIQAAGELRKEAVDDLSDWLSGGDTYIMEDPFKGGGHFAYRRDKKAAIQTAGPMGALVNLLADKNARAGLAKLAAMYGSSKSAGGRRRSGGGGRETINLAEIMAGDELDLDNFDRELEEAMAKLGPTAWDRTAEKPAGLSELELVQYQLAMEAAAKAAVEAQKLQLSQDRGLFASIFGTPAEIELSAEAIQLATQSFDIFANSAGAGFDALITGSDSFGSAMKRALAEGVRALAVDMFIRSLREGAMAVARLAVGDVAGASQHGTAAGLYAAGAAAAGLAANQLGAGGGGARTSAGGQGRVSAPRLISGGAGGSSGGDRNITINMGGDYLGMTAQERAAAMARAIKTARKGSQTIRRQ